MRSYALVEHPPRGEVYCAVPVVVNEWLFASVETSCELDPVRTFSSALSHQQGVSTSRTSEDFSHHSRDCCGGKSQEKSGSTLKLPR